MEPTASSSARPEPAPDVEALAALLDCEADLDALERALLAAAVHPAGGGAEQAWLARWDERRGLLEGWRVHGELAEETDLATCIARARRAPPTEPAGIERVRAWSCTADALEGACEFAWRTGLPATGPGAEQPGAPWAEFDTVSLLSLRRGVRPYGLLVAGWRKAPSHTPELAGLATAANAALAAQVRAWEARRRTRHSAGLAEFARAAVGGGNVAETVHTLGRLAAQALQVRHAAVYRMRDDGTLKLEMAHGPAPARDTQARALQVPAAEVVRANRALAGRGPDDLPGPSVPGAGEVSVWAMQPLSAYGRVLGVLAAWDGPDRHPASPEWERGDLDTLATLADHAALLFEHARRLDELGVLERRRADLASRLREQDRLAALGEMAGRVAEDARQPLASVAAFAARALRDLAEDDPRREYLEVVRREAERIEAVLNEQLAYAQLEAPRLKMESLNSVVQEALRGSTEPLTRRRVRLVKKLAPDLPTLLLDAARIRRVVANIVACALEAVPMGGRMRLETRRAGANVVLDVVHDRTRQAGDALEQLFAPFGAATASGAALGLSVAQQIVREHGGEIRVRSEDEWSSVFSVTLPVLDNQDRRRARDRRGARSDRRRKEPDA
jgi:signal transduction histidine kinase